MMEKIKLNLLLRLDENELNLFKLALNKINEKEFGLKFIFLKHYIQRRINEEMTKKIFIDPSTENLILTALSEKDLSLKDIQGLLAEGFYKTQIFLERLRQEGKVILIPRTKHHLVWRLCKDDAISNENKGIGKGDGQGEVENA
jgi:hypothetical protein